MKLINGIYEGAIKYRSRHPYKCAVHVHLTDTDTEWILSWNATENKRYYEGTFWDDSKCPILRAPFSPLKGVMKRQSDGSYEYRISKSTGDKYMHITQDRVFWYHPPTGHWSFGFILVEKC